MRLEVVRTAPGAADDIPNVTGPGSASFVVSPRALYAAYYGTRTLAPVDVDVSGRLRWDHYIAGGTPGPTSAAPCAPPIPASATTPIPAPPRSARWQLPAWRPRPTTRPKSVPTGLHGFTHYMTADSVAGSWKLSGSAYGDRVIDFITADRARGESQVLMTDRAIVYRNVDAYLAGTSLKGWWQITDTIGLRGKLDWTVGGNLTDHRPLYQVPPLMGEVVAEHRHTLAPDLDGTVGLRLSFAGTQHEVDDNPYAGSAEDTNGPTAGYAVLDLFTGLQVNHRLGISAGVSNLLDKRYRQHVVPFPESPVTHALEAPGRSLFLYATVGY